MSAALRAFSEREFKANGQNQPDDGTEEHKDPDVGGRQEDVIKQSAADDGRRKCRSHDACHAGKSDVSFSEQNIQDNNRQNRGGGHGKPTQAEIERQGRENDGHRVDSAELSRSLDEGGSPRSRFGEKSWTRLVMTGLGIDHQHGDIIFARRRYLNEPIFGRFNSDCMEKGGAGPRLFYRIAGNRTKELKEESVDVIDH